MLKRKRCFGIGKYKYDTTSKIALGHCRRQFSRWIVIIFLGLTAGYVAAMAEEGGETEGPTVMEADTNKDGKSDIWMSVKDQKALRLESDTNFDGKIDCWTHFKDGLVEKIEADTDYDGKVDKTLDIRLKAEVADANKDGKPDTWMYVQGDKALLIESDTNFDGIVDCRTYFKDGQVEKIEADTDYDGKVDVVKQ